MKTKLFKSYDKVLDFVITLAYRDSTYKVEVDMDGWKVRYQ